MALIVGLVGYRQKISDVRYFNTKSDLEKRGTFFFPSDKEPHQILLFKTELGEVRRLSETLMPEIVSPIKG